MTRKFCNYRKVLLTRYQDLRIFSRVAESSTALPYVHTCIYTGILLLHRHRTLYISWPRATRCLHILKLLSQFYSDTTVEEACLRWYVPEREVVIS
jgi:hypothetical protein